jgi:capsular polysaccharide transport system permease protein
VTICPTRSVSNSALAVQIRVITALMLRDVRTRFFGHGAGYLVAVFWPLAHIAILLVLFSATGRVVPFGSSIILYFAVGLAPTMAFIYASRWIMLSTVMNKSLLSFPVVKLFDILIARCILEVLSSCLMCILLLVILSSIGIDVMPASSSEALKAMSAALLLGAGVGFLNGLLTVVLPLWVTGYALVTIIIYMLSGVLFVPDSLPEIGREIVAWNPVLHSVEWMRVAYYGTYTSRTLDKTYLLSFGFGSVFLSLVALRFGQRFLLTSR